MIEPAARYLAFLFAVLAATLTACSSRPTRDVATPDLESLSVLSVEALRRRGYHTRIRPLADLDVARPTGAQPATKAALESPPLTARRLLAAYDSDGLRVYTRIDIPTDPPGESGYPVLVFVHGWYGIDKAPEFDFMRSPGSLYERYIDAFVDAGFLVLSPALRGHGAVEGIPADGIEFLEAWDNGSYLSPMFYAIDVLNLVSGIPQLAGIDWTPWGVEYEVRADLNRISISGHSQGADAVLTALAVSGENSTMHPPLASGSLWSGCFAPRFEQVSVYGPMMTTLEAFMAGDGRWNGTATGADGEVNANFVFGYPPDWIGTIDPKSPDWTWQRETWSTPTVGDAVEQKFTEMYRSINERVADIDGAEFRRETDENGRAVFYHDARVERGMRDIDAYHAEALLSEPIHLHYSDRDFYSLPRWNEDFADRIVAAGGQARAFEYAGNTHGLEFSEHDWFSDGEVVAGFDFMIERDLALFSDPARALSGVSDEDRTSIAALRSYARSMRNEFRREFDREPLGDMQRYVVSFTSDGLRQYALVVTPPGPRPAQGWPVVVMSHGHHPDPPMSGRVPGGRSDRPGDYYRGLPAAYARAGFLVIWPDYRGHNVSQGLEFTRSKEAHAWYARDVIAAVRAIPSLPEADAKNIFLWGHSVGGDVTLRALLALGSEVRGASIWSAWSDQPMTTMVAGPDGLTTPLTIQHAEGDPVYPSAWSRKLQDMLARSGKNSRLYVYDNDDHLFEGATRAQAVERDRQQFTSLLAY